MGRKQARFLWLSLLCSLVLWGPLSCDAPSSMPDAGDGSIGSPDGASCSMCGGSCTDLTSDARNCGSCGNDCGPAASCMGGRCEPAGSGDMSMTRADLGTSDMSMGSDGGLPKVRLCDQTPPMGSTLAPPPPVYAGSCPHLVSGKNIIVSSGKARTFLLAVPTTIRPAEKLPLVFMWHWLGGSADSFFKKGEVQAAVEERSGPVRLRTGQQAAAHPQ